MRFASDTRVVLTLDAGGTHLVFSAIQGNREIVPPIILPTRADHLEACLGNIVDGFLRVRERVPPAAAISFAFPGPGDYPKGIIGNSGNLPAFRGGVALGPMLEDHFGLPTFINNDGDLFTYGEAIAGLLPWVNERLEEAGTPKRYRNLFGVTLGTGFGAGLVSDGRLYLGDNASGFEIWLMRGKHGRDLPVEEGVSIRGLRRAYAEEAGIAWDESPDPKVIAAIAGGEARGNRAAAREAFRRFGELAGDAIANAVTLLDTLVVIGGGLAGAAPEFLSPLIAEMNSSMVLPAGERVGRMESKAFNLEEAAELQEFIRGQVCEVIVPGTGRRVTYDRLLRVGVGLTRLGTSTAVSVGAYAFALDRLDALSSPR